MNVILLERVNNLGDLGDEVSVKAGFARNFLLPKKRFRLTTRIVLSLKKKKGIEDAANEKLSAAKEERKPSTNTF